MFKRVTRWKRALLIPAAAILVISSAGLARIPEPIADGSIIWGDWRLTQVDKDGHTFDAILSFSEDENGMLTGRWIALWGAGFLADLEYTNFRLNFKRIERLGDRDRISSFTGSAERETLEGSLSEEQRGRSKIEGHWIRPMPEAAGIWEGRILVDDQSYPVSLIVRVDKEGKLKAEWKSQWGEHSISDVAFVDDTLTFKRSSKADSRQWESTFEGFVKDETLSGKFKGPQGENAFEAKRLGAGLIGKWLFQIASAAGSHSQILTVNPDLSGLYGLMPIQKIVIDGDNIRFDTALEIGESPKIEFRFTGRREGQILLGEIANSVPSTMKLEGVKLPTPPRRKAVTQSKPLRKPDVPYVATPQHVVDKLLELAAVTKDDVVFDLGCGDGRIVITAAQKFGCRGVGYEIAPEQVKLSRANVEAAKVGNLVSIEQKDIFAEDLSKATVITLYLSPILNAKLIPQLEDLKPGSRIVSHDFDMPGIKPDKVVRIEDKQDIRGDHTLYLWIAPLNQMPIDPAERQKR